MLSAKHIVGKSDRSSKVGQLRPVYRLLLALIAVPILPPYALIDDALAGAGTEHRSSGQSRVAPRSASMAKTGEPKSMQRSRGRIH